MSDAPTTEAAEEAAPPPRDEAREALVAAFREHLGDAVLDSVVANGDAWVRVRTEAWAQAAEVCKQRLGLRYFCFLSGIDWLDNPSLGGKAVWDPAPSTEEAGAPAPMETGVAGGETRFQLLARLQSVDEPIGLNLKCDLDEAAPAAPSWTKVFAGADWHEREAWEMYGFDFPGHPGLRHLYLPSQFEGHPLRKDFPLLSREVKPWPGLVDKEPIPGEGDEEAAAASGEGGES